MQQKSTREYRNNLFVTLFGKSFFARENFLSLYNALHGTQLTLQDVEIKPCMLENTVYAGGLYNDVSMQIDDKIIVLVEQQTTINFNMPLRFLEYVTRIYEQFYSQREKYNRQLVKIPSPEFYVIYNGKEDYPAESEMNLSDAFCNHEKICKNSEEVFLNLKVKVYNINSGKGIELLNKCKPLKDYTAFNDFVLEAKSKGLKDFVGYALDKCIEQDILVDFIKTVNREDNNMIFGDYDYETDIAVQREEALAKGLEQGAREKAEQNAENLIKMQLGSLDQISQATGVPLERVKELSEGINV